MDIEHARTFVAVSETRNFARAAEQLYITQSTVSSRIKVLEDQVGSRLFTRSKAGVSLTAAGAKFSRHAVAMVRIWSQARQEIALPDNFRARINIGAQISHWDEVMVEWLCWLRDAHPGLAVGAEIGAADALMRQMIDGLLDFAVIYTPHAGPGLQVEKLFEERIVLVSTRRHLPEPVDGVPGWASDYVFVDWGPEYRSEHALAWPALPPPAVHFSVGRIALDFILQHGGTGYFPMRMVRRRLNDRTLFRVPRTPSFERPVFLIRTNATDEPPLDAVLDGLRRIAIETGTRPTPS